MISRIKGIIEPLLVYFELVNGKAKCGKDFCIVKTVCLINPLLCLINPFLLKNPLFKSSLIRVNYQKWIQLVR